MRVDSLCHMTVSVMWLFLTVWWIGLQCVSVAFPGHTHFLSKASQVSIQLPKYNTVSSFLLKA